MKKFNPYHKPPYVCPEEYCFNWSTTQYNQSEHCTAPECKRLDSKARIDAFEPNEHKMADDGLPWFYFTHPDNMVDVTKKKFMEESPKYWNNKSEEPEEW